MTKLAFYNDEPMDKLVCPEDTTEITTRSCAMEVFTSFNEFKPRILDASISAIEAVRLMHKTGEHLKFIVDKDNYVLGVVSLDNLNSREITKKVSDGSTREQIPVTDFINPKFRFKAIDYFDLENISIDDVIYALTETGHRHCLVIDWEQGIVRGVISASDIVKRLK